MDRIQELEAIVAQFNLNSHPFYQDWKEGTLPVGKLQDYASEYGHFVATIAKGWETLGFDHYADEEREHEALWGDFKAAIDANDQAPKGQTEALVTAADRYFGIAAAAPGALYAFEAQQPITSQAKYDGLVAHYTVDDKGKEYFKVHAGDFNEVEDLKKHVANMSDAEFAQTKAACAVLCAAMWSALDGVYYA